MTYAFDNIFVCNTFYIRKYNTRVGISLESEFLKCKILIPDYAANSGNVFFIIFRKTCTWSPYRYIAVRFLYISSAALVGRT